MGQWDGPSMAASAEVRRSPVQEALTGLDRELDDLGQQVEVLMMKLQPILIPQPETRNENVPPVLRDQDVPLAQEIRLRKERIQQAARHIRTIQEAVGI